MMKQEIKERQANYMNTLARREIRFNLTSSQTTLYHYLCNLDNGARCTETSVFITRQFLFHVLLDHFL